MEHLPQLRLIEVRTEAARLALEALLAQEADTKEVSFHTLLIDPLPHELDPEFQASLDEAIASVERGEGITMEEFKAELAERRLGLAKTIA
jgi:hypothetical protein